MIYIVLIGLFVVFYAVFTTSYFKVDGLPLLSLIIDLGIIVAFIIFYFIGGYLELNDLHNYLMFTYFGSFVYMYFAIKTFWIKPSLLKYMVEKDNNPDEEQLETQELDLRTARIRAIYYFIIAILLMGLTHIHMHPELQEDLTSMNPLFVFIGLIIIIIWLILDVYRKIKYGVFLFKTIVPLVVTIYIFINTITM
ncbi:DUF5080 family protein [Staphylococcus ratti]|uniref:DUF5080 family protein n=1 Tax=Staphylococcus ratti TaxID=2892440 RepID=A0ABY3PCG5_9STAP|nr:DUF5080 family protein [Staphylococcus ratti]UEX90011.1 DUF5080 family protein [Staphylococcus ratti]